MSDGRQEPENRSGNTWWIAGAALLLGYYVGQGETPTDSGIAYAEAPPAIDTSAIDTEVAAVDAETASAELLAAEEATDGTDEDAVADDSDESADQYAYTESPAVVADNSDEEDGTELASSESDEDTLAAAAGAAAAAGTRTGYQSATSSGGYAQSGNGSAWEPRTRSGYQPPAVSYSAPKCESLGCYGAISATTGRPRTQYVSGYTRKDGTYVRPYYRSKRN